MPASQIQIYPPTLPLGKKKGKINKKRERRREACTFGITRRQNNADCNLDVNGKVETQSSNLSEFPQNIRLVRINVEERREQHVLRDSRT